MYGTHDGRSVVHATHRVRTVGGVSDPEPPIPPADAAAAPPDTGAPLAVTDADADAVEDAPVVGAVAESATEAGAPAATPAPPPKPEIRLVPGTVLAVTDSEIEIQLRDGQVAVVDRREATDRTSPLPVVGADVEGAVLARTAPDGRMLLSLTWAAKHRAWERIAELAASGDTFDCVVTSASDGGVIVDAGVRGFIPASHLEIEPATDLPSYVGRTLTVKVLDHDVDRERLVVTRRSLLLREERKRRHKALADLSPGDRRTGTVTRLADYGAFVDIGGATGLVHVSELSWNRVRRPEDVVAVGDTIEVEVLDVKLKKRRLALSARRVHPDPLAGLEPGQIHEGPVSRLADFGVFVDLGGVDGLVHRSELTEMRINAVSDVVAPGERVRVLVLSVDRKRRRVELSVRQAATHLEDSA